MNTSSPLLSCELARKLEMIGSAKPKNEPVVLKGEPVVLKGEPVVLKGEPVVRNK